VAEELLALGEGVAAETAEGEELFARQVLEIGEGVEACADEGVGDGDGETLGEPPGGAAGDLAAEEVFQAGEGERADAAEGEEVVAGLGLEVGGGVEARLVERAGGHAGDAVAKPDGDAVGGRPGGDGPAEEELAGLQRTRADAVQGEKLFARHGGEAAQSDVHLGEGDRRGGRKAPAAPEGVLVGRRAAAGHRPAGQRVIEEAGDGGDGGMAEARDGEERFAGDTFEVAQRAIAGGGQGAGGAGGEPGDHPEPCLGVTLAEGGEAARWPPSPAPGTGTARHHKKVRRLAGAWRRGRVWHRSPRLAAERSRASA